ncbi:MAG: putative Phenylalanine racemase (ATP-hydrolyzing) [Burkholderiales bacterium]|jgi:surfactin family lipopeptide synthetase A|nr:putative Phenylalanine racemase (ATP-hydrolyzing) [Burkholderiales bacterium]
MYKIRLSPYHKIFYNEWKLDPSSSKYNIVFDQTISKNLNIQRLKRALTRFIRDYVIFNSHIVEIDGEPHWVKNSKTNQLEVSEVYTASQIFEYVSKPFNLISEPLYRFAIFKEANGNCRFIILLHHLIIDGNGFDTFISTISAYYNSTKYTCEFSLSEQLKLIAKSTETLDEHINANTKKSTNFWQSKLAECEVVDLRFLKSYTANKKIANGNLIKELRFSFNKVQIVQLDTILNKYRLTEYVYSLCIFAILLYRYTSQERFAISYPLSIKGDAIGFIYGAKINTNIMPVEFNNNITVPELFKAIKDFIKSLKSGKSNYSSFPIDRIISVANPGLLNVMFAQTKLKDVPFSFKNTEILSINKEFNIDLFCPLCFEQESRDQNLNFCVRYNSLETDETILQNFIRHYQKLFGDVLESLANENSKTLISEYPILFPEEYQQIVYDWNKTEAPYPKDKTIHQLFEEQVEKTPDNIAVVFEDKQLTYRELNNRANQLANYLRETYQIKGDDLIALCLNRNEYMIIAILGVLKSGAAYVPIAPDYPIERIKYILKNTQATTLITDAKCYSSAKRELSLNVLIIDDQEFNKILKKYKLSTPRINVTSKNLAYVIYTSGTTGTPKGVMIEHRNVVSLVRGVEYIAVSNSDCIMQLADTAFDASTFEIWSGLLNGARIYFPNDVFHILSDIEIFGKVLNDYKVSILWLTKTLFDELYLHDKTLFKGLRYLLVGGEALNYQLMNKLLNSRYCPKYLINGYGPTENATFSCTFKITKYNIRGLSTIPIGKPITNRVAYILNDNLIPVPLGGVGNLYVSGTGVARGYLNQRALEKRSFFDNPFQTEAEKKSCINSRLYKTGDLARMLPNHNLEYLGRHDSQVKIRGYRVELREIEHKLAQYPKIKQAIVLVNPESNHIAAYYVADRKLEEANILGYLKAELPEYMMPQSLIYIKKIPIRKNGKVDVQVLPNHRAATPSRDILPKNLLESQICKIFAETLNLKTEKVNANHDFFALGGNSISAIRLAAKLQRNFNISVNDIFRLRTPAKISDIAQYTNDHLLNKIERIKQLYMQAHHISNEVENPKTMNVNFLKNLKNISTVLLSGATGYLGCHILYQLLKDTDYKLCLLVRNTKPNFVKNIYSRIHDKFSYYFKINLDDYYNRLIVLESDLTKPDLGLNEVTYKELATDVDSIIHCAALVKHYGNYEDFYKANVQSTINLLELCKLTKYKDFHYISTIGIFTDSNLCLDVLPAKHKNSSKYTMFTEASGTDRNLERKFYTYYTQTKYKGEQITLKYRQYGLKTSIYRVGNLSMNSKTYKIQENIEENAFFQRVKTILNFGVVPKELSEVEISPVDCVAEAVVRLFRQDKLYNQIYHVFNPKICNLYELFVKCKNVNIILTSFSSFIDTIKLHLDNNSDAKQLELFMLHQGWLNEEIGINNFAKNIISQDRTNTILTNLSFTWPNINSEMLSHIIKQSFIRINKMMEREQILKHLDFIAQMVPAAFYLMDTIGRFISVNEGTLKATGAIVKENIINKTVYELYKNKEVADVLQKDIKEVIRTGKTSIKEDKIVDVSTGKYRYFTAIRAPLRDYEGGIFGIIGTSVEITAEKEADRLKHENRKLDAQNKIKQVMLEKEAAESERLRLENEVHKLEKRASEAIAKEQQNFRKVADRVAHDLRPPVASITYIAKSQAANLPEEERVTLRDAGNRINDLANYLLSYYKPVTPDSETQNQSLSLLVSGAITEILSEKRWQYTNLPVKFTNKFHQGSYFTFINIPAVGFKSMLSNLINNSVDALEKKEGEVVVELECEDDMVKITIQDNGKGMPQEVLDKIMNNIAVTAGKQDGHGIGLTQVRETLAQNKGSFTINSKPGAGTKIVLTFPKAIPPIWVCEKLELKDNDIIIVVDDDPSIHGSWDSRFAVAAPHFKLKHFNQGNEAIDFINALSTAEKQRVFLLTDYELLKQGLNGLDIIQKTGLKRSVLVTSRYEDKPVQKSALATNTKILPKLLALEIPIFVTSGKNHFAQQKTDIKELIQLELVVVDDYEPLTENLLKTVLKGRNVAVFNDVKSFLDNVYKYKRDTKIILDNNFENYDGDIEGISFTNTGFSLAKKLHNDGFTDLYISSGDKFDSVPDYLKVIAKHHYDDIEALLSPYIKPPQKSDELIRSEIFREVMANFIYANYRDERYYFSDIEDLVHKTRKGRLKSGASNARLDSIIKSVKDRQKQSEDNRDIIQQAGNILNGNIKNYTEFFQGEISQSSIYELSQLALKNDVHLLDNNDIRKPHYFSSFTFLGNKLIVEVIISILLRYIASQIKQQKGVGNIHIDTESMTKHNHLLISYTMQMLNGQQITSPSKFENLPNYSENLKFCKNAMRLFGGDISLNPAVAEGVEFVLSFPKIGQTKVKQKTIKALR